MCRDCHYPETIKKLHQPSFWTRLKEIFHRKSQPKILREPLLLDDQLAYSSKYECYEHIEDEE